MFATLIKSIPIVIKYLIGIFPLYFGFSILAWAIFWKSFRFRSLSASLFSQFALLNGDAIFDTYNDITTYNFAFAWFYLYLFILMFIWVVYSIMISIFQNYFQIIKNDY